MAKSDTSPLGPMLGHRYYCGFCKDVYIVQNFTSGGYIGPLEWYGEYCEHLRKHFEGKNLVKKMWAIDEWEWLPVFE